MPYDFKKEWEKTRKQLIKFGQEAADIAKKGEKELYKFSQQGKLHLDSTAIGLKKERLYYQIGKEYVKLKNPVNQPLKIKKLVDEVKKLDRQQRLLKGKLKTSAKKKTSTKRK